MYTTVKVSGAKCKEVGGQVEKCAGIRRVIEN